MTLCLVTLHKPANIMVVLVAWLCLMGLGVRGQIPLPTLSQGAGVTHTGAAAQGPGVGLPQQSGTGAVGVPLPPLGHGQAPVGVPLPTVSAHHPELVATTGVSHGPVIVPLDVASVGVPLPPYQHGPAAAAGATGLSHHGGVQTAAGGLRAVNAPSKDEAVKRVSALASVRERLQKETRADNAVKITNIITAHKQVVAGQLVYLSAKVSETKCPIGTPDLSACVLDLSEDDHICEIVVWERPWLNSSKIIDEKTRCVDAEDDVDFDAWGPVNRLGFASSPASEINIPNLPDHIDEKQMSIEAFNYVDSASDSKFRGEMVSYDIEDIMLDPVLNQTKVRVKVEYGFTYCIKWVGRTEQRLCPHNPDHDHYVCSVTVVDNPNEITSLSVSRDRDDDIPCIRKREVQEELVIPVRAPCLGCPQAAPLSDPTILEIADFALTEYDRTSNDDDLHMVLKLIKAQTQVVAGIKYYLTMEIAETTCNKFVTGVDVNRTFCNQDHTEETKFCDIVVIEQSWIPTRDLVDARCTDAKSYGSSSVDEFIVPIGIGGVSLHNAVPHQGNLGSSPLFSEPSSSNAHNSKSIADEEAHQLAELISLEYNHREDDDEEYYKVVKIHEATVTASGGRRMVVELGETFCNKRQLLTPDAGLNCQLDPTEETEVCIAEIADPLNTHTLSHFHCQDMDDYLVTKMSPSLSSFHVMDQPFLNFPEAGSQGIPGGMQSQNTESREIKDLANYVTQQYNLRSDDDELYILTNVISAHSQVVSGGKFLLEVEVSESHCKKYQLIADSSRCPLAFDEEPEVCQAEVMIGANQQRELSRLYCDDRNDYYTNKILRDQHLSHGAIGGSHGAVGGSSGFTAGGLTGGWSHVDVNDTKLQRLALMVADEFDLRSDEENIFVVHHLVEAKQQVVSGMNYHLVIELAETVCPKYKTSINKARCHVDIGEEHMVCEAKVWEQSWLNKLEVTDLRCAEKEEFSQGDDSVEILFPSVHPTSHARPVFLNKFFRDTSVESEESNERFYRPGTGGRSIHRHDDSDEDDSDELPSFSRHRGKRSVGSSHLADPLDPKVLKLAEFAINNLDALGDDPRRRVLTEVLSAKKKVVSGVQWSLRILVTWTSCMKDDLTVPSDSCPADANEPQYTCDITIFEKPWVSVKKSGGHFRKVKTAMCTPIITPSQ